MKQLLCLSVFLVAGAVLLPQHAAAAEPAGSSTAASSGAAPSAADRNTARRLATEGQKALKAGDYEKAADHFQRANELVNAPTLLLGVARARVGQGRLLEGYEIYDGIVRAGVAPDASKAFKKAVADAKAESAALEARLAWVTVSVRGAEASQTTVTLNEQPLPIAALGVERPVNPGTIHARAEAPGYRPAEAEVQLKEGERGPILELTLVEIPKAEPEVLAAQSSVMRTDGGASPNKTMQTLGYVGLGVGGAAIVVGAVAGIIAYNRHAELVDCADDTSTCSGGVEGAEELNDDYHKFATIADVAVISGGVLAAAGLVLILAAPDEQPPTEAHITPYVGLGSIGAVGTF
jgi:hypothetical protein